MFVCYHVFKTYVIEKYVFMSFCLNPCYHPPMFVCYSVSKTYVIKKLCLFGILSLNPMFFCLIQKPHPVSWGWGCVPRKRENQINTLVLKDINFTINIIDCLITERLIPWINLKNAPVVKASPSPSEGGDVHNPTYRLSVVSNYIQ